MAQGRCEGCGKTGSACKIETHCAECPKWLALPFDRQLDPALSYAGWVAEGKSAERASRKRELAEREVELRSVADARWATPADILE